jgi:hypothetical protein
MAIMPYDCEANWLSNFIQEFHSLEIHICNIEMLQFH